MNDNRDFLKMAFITKALPIIVQPVAEARASIIFLHGSGDTGDGLWWWLQNLLGSSLEFKHIRMIIPTAPSRPYTAHNGASVNVWFDRTEISLTGAEDDVGTRESCKYLDSLVESQVSLGIPKSRILIGGFSMGGSLALHYGYRFCPDIAGIFALSSFLYKNSAVYQAIKASASPKSFPPLLQCHGERDKLVMFDWGKDTHETLKSLGVPCMFHTYPDLFHQLIKEEIVLWKGWAESTLGCQ